MYHINLCKKKMMIQKCVQLIIQKCVQLIIQKCVPCRKKNAIDVIATCISEKNAIKKKCVLIFK